MIDRSFVNFFIIMRREFFYSMRANFLPLFLCHWCCRSIMSSTYLLPALLMSSFFVLYISESGGFKLLPLTDCTFELKMRSRRQFQTRSIAVSIIRVQRMHVHKLGRWMGNWSGNIYTAHYLHPTSSYFFLCGGQISINVYVHYQLQLGNKFPDIFWSNI